MAFTPVEIIALILILVTIIKLLVISISQQAWYNNVARKIWSNTKLTSTISFILAIIVLHYLLQEITIVQILAVTVFIILLMVIGSMAYSQEIQKFTDKIYKQRNILRKAWFYTLIWIILLLWGLSKLFF